MRVIRWWNSTVRYYYKDDATPFQIVLLLVYLVIQYCPTLHAERWVSIWPPTHWRSISVTLEQISFPSSHCCKVAVSYCLCVAPCWGQCALIEPRCWGQYELIEPRCWGQCALIEPRCWGQCELIEPRCWGQCELIEPRCCGQCELIEPRCCGQCALSEPRCWEQYVYTHWATALWTVYIQGLNP